MDGTIADFECAFHAVEVRLFGAESHVAAGTPEAEEEHETAGKEPSEAHPIRDEKAKIQATRRIDRESRRRRDATWQAIRATPDFWATLKPLEDGVVQRMHALMLHHSWEVFFITQRPATDGETVQRQTQRWLVEQGFDWPSVLVIHGSRGAAARALRLDYHVDDSAQNCLDVKADSRASPILIVPDDDEKTVVSARKLGIGTARGIGDALDILEQASVARLEPGLLGRLAAIVGWR